MQKFSLRFISVALLAGVLSIIMGFTACEPGTASGPAGPGETAATVNGKAIKMEEVERVIKQQAQGQEAKLSPLELAQVRLQALDSLIQQEVMYQRAEAEKTIPSDDEVTAEFNKRKTASGMSADEFAKKMAEIGETEESAREAIKKGLAIQKLMDKVTGKVEPPKDTEIEGFFNGNKEAFIKKKGVKLAAIVVDPADNGEGDTTKDEASAVLKANEIIGELRQGKDFATLAAEKSEDQSRLQRGELGYISEEQLKQQFPAQTVAALMDPKTPVGQTFPQQMQGKYYVFKLQERSDKDEAQTLETPGIRQQITDALIDARKKLLTGSYTAIAMDEAKIQNFLAKRVIENPNELSGSRPAQPENANANANANANTASNANANANANAKAGDKKEDPKKEEAKPAASNTANANTSANSGK